MNKNLFVIMLSLIAGIGTTDMLASCGSCFGGDARPNCGPAPRCEKVEQVLVTREAIPVCGWQCPADCVRSDGGVAAYSDTSSIALQNDGRYHQGANTFSENNGGKAGKRNARSTKRAKAAKANQAKRQA